MKIAASTVYSGEAKYILIEPTFERILLPPVGPRQQSHRIKLMKKCFLRAEIFGGFLACTLICKRESVLLSYFC